ncbi:hypothetical protein JL2886_00943 [Phaeobacter gallaeciensis]|uniref:Uncharacterized protein n=1 Tax=Phaeobacter gallaeciensis TaxID=60890 RepID=A0A1B0ZNV8_9RHOB|nr:hypothetical protein JL2886_00943 [Phaeobacter gallaeciensis]
MCHCIRGCLVEHLICHDGSPGNTLQSFKIFRPQKTGSASCVRAPSHADVLMFTNRGSKVF